MPLTNPFTVTLEYILDEGKVKACGQSAIFTKMLTNRFWSVKTTSYAWEKSNLFVYILNFV